MKYLLFAIAVFPISLIATEEPQSEVPKEIEEIIQREKILSTKTGIDIKKAQSVIEFMRNRIKIRYHSPEEIANVTYSGILKNLMNEAKDFKKALESIQPPIITGCAIANLIFVGLYYSSTDKSKLLELTKRLGYENFVDYHIHVYSLYFNRRYLGLKKFAHNKLQNLKFSLFHGLWLAPINYQKQLYATLLNDGMKICKLEDIKMGMAKDWEQILSNWDNCEQKTLEKKSIDFAEVIKQLKETLLDPNDPESWVDPSKPKSWVVYKLHAYMKEGIITIAWVED